MGSPSLSTAVAVVAVAGTVAMLAGVLLLRADRLTEDARGTRRRRRGPPSGLVLGVATVAGFLGVSPFGGIALRLLAIATLLGAFGLLTDHRRLRPWVRVTAEGAAGGAAVLLGLRTSLTATTLVSILALVMFVVVVVESLRLLDAAPRVAASVSAASLAGLVLVAGDQGGITTLALALVGALAGLLAAGTRRTFWLGESGCLFCGLLLATLVVAVTPATPAPLSLAVLLPVIAVPLLNTALVGVGRLRRRQSLTSRRPDGLAHRLRATRLPWARVVLVLAGAQAVLSTVVVLADRSVLPVAAPLLALAGATLLALPGRAQARRRAAPGLSMRVRLAGLGVMAAVGIATLPAALALVQAQAEVRAASVAAERGLAAARAGELGVANTAFAQAEGTFSAADERIRGPLTSLGLAVPVLGPNLAAIRSLTDIGLMLSRTGASLATAAPQALRVSEGRVPIEEVARLVPELETAAVALRRAHTTASTIRRPYLLAPLRDRLDDVEVRLEQASTEAGLAAQSASLLPALLGSDGPRRYFLAVQNNAELRATGGFLGNYGELVADDGVLRLERFGRHQELNEAGPPVKDLRAPQDYLDRYSRFEVASTWESVNLSPDFPTVGQVIAGLYPQSGGRPIDGVVSIDPVGLAAMLRLTGPIEVEGWPDLITADNVVDITLNEAYVDYDRELDERIQFLGQVAAASIAAFTTGDLGSPAEITAALADAARGGHLSVFFTDVEEQALADALRITGQIEPVEADSLLVVNQNAAANKIDYYLRRRLDYEVQLRPGSERMEITGRLKIDMENQAPASGLPEYVIGPFDDRFQAGENFSYVSLYSPFALSDALWDGAPVELEAEEELGRNVYSAFLSIPARSTRTLEVELEGSVAAQAGGWYELDLLHQPLLVGDDVTVSVEVAEGWRIAEVQGGELDSPRRAVARLALERDETIRVRLVEDP